MKTTKIMVLLQMLIASTVPADVGAGRSKFFLFKGVVGPHSAKITVVFTRETKNVEIDAYGLDGLKVSSAFKPYRGGHSGKATR